MSRRHAALLIAALAAGAGCKKRSLVAPLLPIVERFAVGAIPYYRQSAPLGEAPLCIAEFPASDVVALEPGPDGATIPRVVKEGVFTGSCGGKPLLVAFRGVKVARTQVKQTAGHEGMGPFELLLAHPDWKVELQATPLDERGERLDTGWRASLARWKMRPGCERVLKSARYGEETPPGLGFDRPWDLVLLAPVGVGVCTIDVDYLGAPASATLTVR